MKKLNANKILFVFVTCFIMIGLFGGCFISLMKASIKMLSGFKHLNAAVIMEGKTSIDKVSSEELSYHDLMMDLNSIRLNLMGNKVVVKDDTTIVKSESGSLCEPSRRLDDTEINEVLSRIQELQKVSKENGAGFLYFAAPKKEYYEKLPANVADHTLDNYDRFAAGLRAFNIPSIIFSEVIEENNIPESDLFYNTDHHWKSRIGFLAASSICEELSARYGFEFDERYIDLKNYNIDLYRNWFLGARGKKVGTWFTWKGADDFELISPAFETDMTELQPYKEEVRTGTFQDTVLFMENMEKSYYHKSPYSTYSGGDFRLQIMKNNLNPYGKKVLLVRDSYACAVAPFLALQTSELHICDMRNYEGFVGDKINLKDYIQKIRPDYVIVLYNNIGSVEGSNGKYNFF